MPLFRAKASLKKSASTEAILTKPPLHEPASAKPRLIHLEQLHIPEPCPVSWDTMVGNEQVRFCSQCQKSVFNLSAMTAPAADALLREGGSTICVSYCRRSDGSARTRDETVVRGESPASRGWLRWLTASWLALFCAAAHSQPQEQPEMRMGGAPVAVAAVPLVERQQAEKAAATGRIHDSGSAAGEQPKPQPLTGRVRHPLLKKPRRLQ